MGVFFATSARTHLGPHQFFGIAFWIGFSINAVVIELLVALQDEAQNSTNRSRTLRGLQFREANVILTCGPDLSHSPTRRAGTDKRACVYQVQSTCLIRRAGSNARLGI